MKAPRDRKRSNDPAALRRRVLDAAAEAFQAGGYHSTSTHDIMRAANVTGGAFHHHFPTKKSLALAVIRERVAPAVEDAWIAPVRAGRTALDGILDAFDAIVSSLKERGRVVGCPLNNIAIELSLTDPDCQAAVAEVFERWRKAISDRIRKDQGNDRGPLNPDETGTFVVAAYSGAIAMAKAKQNPEPLQACARQLAIVLGNGRPARGKSHRRS